MKTVELLSYGPPVIEANSFLAILDTYDSSYCEGCSHGPGGKLLSKRYVRIYPDGDVETICKLPTTDRIQLEAINAHTLLQSNFTNLSKGDWTLKNIYLVDLDKENVIPLFSHVLYASMTDDKRFLYVADTSDYIGEADLFEMKDNLPQRIGSCPRNEFRYSLLSDKNITTLKLGSCMISCNSIVSYIPGTNKTDTIYIDSTLELYSAEATYHPDYVFIKAYKKDELDSLFHRMDSLNKFYRNATSDEIWERRVYERKLTDIEIVDGYYAKWRLLNIKTRRMIDIDLHAYYPYMSKDQKSVLFVVYGGSADKVYDEKWKVVSLEDMISGDKN